MNGLYEILGNKLWMASPDFIHSVRAAIQQNLTDHIVLDEKDKKPAARAFLMADGSINIEELRYSAKDGSIISAWKENTQDPFISVLYAVGAITRHGGGCSYGSIDFRKMMMQAADDVNCVGHIFYIDSPGGSAWAKNDFQQAIDYARSKRQPVLAFIDGMCCSAGMYLAALCDERYYMNPKDEVGCIGVVAAFYSVKDGSYNQYNNATYHEIYDPESEWKNKEMRDIANNDNDELLVEELKKLGDEFRNDVKAACPRASDDHLKGKVFNAEDVKGILMTGQSDLEGVFARVIKLSAANGVPAGKNAQEKTLFNKKDKVENKYQALAQLMGVESLVVTESGTHLDVTLLDTLLSNIEAMKTKSLQVDNLIQELSDTKAEFETKLAEKDSLIQEAKEAHETAIAALQQKQTEMQADIDGKQTIINQLQSDMEGYKTNLSTAKQTITERDQQITDLNARISELESEPDTLGGGKSPDSNGEGIGVVTTAVGRYVYDTSKSHKENMKLKKEFEEAKK